MSTVVHLSRSDCNCGSCSCSMLPGEEKIVVISGLKDLLYYCNRLEIPDEMDRSKISLHSSTLWM
jgi:hypothetical protein